MTDKELQQADEAGLIEQVAKPLAPIMFSPETPTGDPLDEYRAVLDAIRRPRIFLTAAPTFKPKNRIDAEQDVLIAGIYYKYYYIDSAWRKVALT